VPFVDKREIEEFERLPGWHGRIFSSPNMTFAEWRFTAGARIHEHHHVQEEVWQILEGELEISIGGETRRAGPGMAAIVRQRATLSKGTQRRARAGGGLAVAARNGAGSALVARSLRREGFLEWKFQHYRLCGLIVPFA
jgi:hypothetical protein